MTITYKLVNIGDLTVSEINNVNSWMGESPDRDIAFLFRLIEDKRSFIVLAYDANTLVASSVVTPATFFKDSLQLNSALMDWLSENNIPLEKCTVSCFFYVRSDYRGKGIGDSILRRRAEKAIELGYSHSLSYGYETFNIFSYISNFPDSIHTGVIDTVSGYEIILRKHLSCLK